MALSGGRWKLARHLEYVSNRITPALIAGDARFIIELPVRHGKSEIFSHWLPAWFLSTFRERYVIQCGYSDPFARHWGRKTRDEIIRNSHFLELRVPRETSSAADWATDAGGGMLSAGIGGGITGRGADLMVIDDPMKSREEAESEVKRESIYVWWRETARMRLEPGGSVIIVMSRWHEEDLSGRLQKEMDEDWHVIRLPALAEEDDPLGRALGSTFEEQPEAGGEALWPERYSRVRLLKTKRAGGTRAWSSNFQQRPRPLEGTLIKPHELCYFTEEGNSYILSLNDGRQVRRSKDEGLRFVMVDLAVSLKESAHFFAVSAFHLTGHQELLLLDAERTRLEAPQQLKAIWAMIRKWDAVYAGIESQGYQLSMVQNARQSGMPVRELGIRPQERVDPQIRAETLHVRCEAGLFFLKRGADWLDWVELEITGFPVEGAGGGHYDTLTTCAYAAIHAAGRAPMQGDIGLSAEQVGGR